MLTRRNSNVFTETSTSLLTPAATYTVTAYRRGGICSGPSTTTSATLGGLTAHTTTIPLYSGHGIAINDAIMVGIDTTTFNRVSASTSTSIQVQGQFSVNTGDTILTLGADTGTTTPNFDGSDVLTYSTPDTTTAITQARVTTSETGDYGYWHDGTVGLWELMRDTSGAAVSYVLDVVVNEEVGPSSSTDNAVARWDGASGRLLQDSVVLVSDSGAVTGVSSLTTSGAAVVGTTLTVTGASTVAALTASGTVTTNGALAASGAGTGLAVTNNQTIGGTLTVTGTLTASAAASVGTTLGVTGATTLTGGVAGGNPYNMGTWPITSVTSGTDTACTNGTAYVGSVHVHRNCTLTGIQYLVGSVGGTDKVIVSLHNSAGTLLANSATAGTTVGTAAQAQQVAFTAPYAAVGPGLYYLALTFNGTTAKFRTIPAFCNVGNGVVGNSVTQTFGTPATFTAPTTFTADKVPVMSLY